MTRLLVALFLAVSGAFVPVATAQACSCSGLGGSVDVAQQAAADADVAFVGTVVDVRDVPIDLNAFGPSRAYAFEVRSASAPVAPTIEAIAQRNDGMSCGFDFGMGEEWFVTAYVQDGSLHTGLCSGNAKLTRLAPGDVERLMQLAPIEPEDASRAFAPDPFALARVAAATLAVGLVTVLAFRRGRVR